MSNSPNCSTEAGTSIAESLGGHHRSCGPGRYSYLTSRFDTIPQPIRMPIVCGSVIRRNRLVLIKKMADEQPKRTDRPMQKPQWRRQRHRRPVPDSRTKMSNDVAKAITPALAHFHVKLRTLKA